MDLIQTYLGPLNIPISQLLPEKHCAGTELIMISDDDSTCGKIFTLFFPTVMEKLLVAKDFVCER